MELPSTSVRSSIVRPSGLPLDALFVVLSTLLVAGIAADFRAHSVRGVSFAEEGFLTPEHAFFYTAFLAVAVLVGAATYANRRRGRSWTASVPPGYGWAVVGVLVFGLGGVGDVAWHSAFGFEKNLEALTSPSHLALGVGAVLFLTAPLRSALLRSERPSGAWALPAIVSASLALTILTLFGGYVNPVLQTWAYPTYQMNGARKQATLVALLVYPTVLVGAALVLDRAARLPPGSITLLVLLPFLAAVVGGGWVSVALAVLAAGVVGDLLVQFGAPLFERPRLLRGFGALVPLSFAGTYFGALGATRGVAWSIHLWAGTIVLAGGAGLLLTYVVLPISPRATARDPV